MRKPICLVTLIFVALLSIAWARHARALEDIVKPGDILVADHGSASIVRVDPQTGAQSVVTSGGYLTFVNGIAVGPTGTISVSNHDPFTLLNNGVVQIDPASGAQTLFSVWSIFPSQPWGIGAGPGGDVFVADHFQQSVFRIDSTGARTTLSAGGFDPHGIEVASNGDVYVGHFWHDGTCNGGVYRIDASSGARTLVSSGGVFCQPFGLTIGAGDEIWVANTIASSIVRVDPVTGAQTTVSSGGLLSRPFDLAVASGGEIYVGQGDKVIRIEPSGGAQTLISSGGSLTNIWGITIYNPFTSVTIDIKPGSDPNSINLGSNGTVPVAILSTSSFDATTVDPSSVTLAGASVALRGHDVPMASVEDVDRDGLPDLVVHFSIASLQLTAADTTATLEGKTFDGQRIRGSDSVHIVP